MLGVIITTALSFILYLFVLLTLLITKKNKKAILKHGVSIFIVAFILFSIIIYVIMPTITIPNMLLSNLLVGLITTALLFVMIEGVKVYKAPQNSIIGFVFILAIVALPIVFIAGFFALDDSYESIDKEEQDQSEPLSKEDTPIAVAPESARNKMQKAMSVVPNPQFYDLGKLQVQKIDEEIVYVAPLEFTGFWKYLRGSETEGYFRISATNVNAQPEFVDSKMSYTNSSYFNDNIQRVIYNQYPQYIQSGEAQIEVDEQGKPWYVQTLYQPVKITNKPNMNELMVAVVDPVTGELSLYQTNQAPDFIEGSVSSEMAALQNEYFGNYVHGWFNSLFGKKDVRIPNDSGTEKSVTPIFDENGEMFYFTDMTSPKENIDSALGYTLIHARTGTLTYYNGDINNGIMDSEGAKQIVNKEFPEKNWEGSMPILYNIDGNPTWVVNVLDPNGLFKHYAYIDASDSDFVVFGDTAEGTLDAYRIALQQDPGRVESTEEVEAESRSGIVYRVLVITTDTSQVVQFLLDGEETIYTINASNQPLAVFLQEGDEVTMQVKVRDEQTATVEEMTIEGLTE
ncbi:MULTISPECIES: DNA-binding protein [Paraliobacillus]|uniref:DNA-binding protein n=1 Tax=Paraliobacillus TaxID=200903 RepID=UPI000DD472F6|nr:MULTISPECIES: DNA-binding protein [Paraliobacillus]